MTSAGRARPVATEIMIGVSRRTCSFAEKGGAKVSAMARRVPGPGRPSKGDRWPVYVRLPRHVADQVRADADRLDISYSDMMASLAAEHYGVSLELPRVDLEDQLPLSA
jgi:hypothetical protein